MCYSGVCPWEDSNSGDCIAPYKYLDTFVICHCSWEEKIVTLKEIERFEEIELRNKKINKIISNM